MAPRFHRQVEALRKQHAGFALEIGRIATLAQMASGGAESWQAVGRDFTAFAETLRAHEEAESEIMQSAFLEDLGTCD